MYKELAIKFRKFIEQMATNATDEEALNNIEAFPLFKVGVQYKKDDRVRYENTLYKVLQDHTSQSDWTPDVAVSLFVRIDDPAIEWPEWVQPLGSTDAYPFGAKVSHNEKRWVSNVGNNVWEPGVYGWDEHE